MTTLLELNMARPPHTTTFLWANAHGELKIGPYDLGHRNHSGQMLVNFLEMEGLFLMNLFYKKQPQGSVAKKEINFIMADTRHMFRDVSVVN